VIGINSAHIESFYRNPTESRITAADFTADGRNIVCAYKDGRISILSFEERNITELKSIQLDPKLNHLNEVTYAVSLMTHPDAKIPQIIVGGSDGHVHVIDY